MIGSAAIRTPMRRCDGFSMPNRLHLQVKGFRHISPRIGCLRSLPSTQRRLWGERRPRIVPKGFSRRFNGVGVGSTERQTKMAVSKRSAAWMGLLEPLQPMKKTSWPDSHEEQQGLLCAPLQHDTASRPRMVSGRELTSPNPVPGPAQCRAQPNARPSPMPGPARRPVSAGSWV
ncbi:MAG: hypothetical protein RLZZ117_1238 [Cyanobacteriota bacterium]|jgi:hypothetical protein